MPAKETLDLIANRWLGSPFLKKFLELGNEYQKKIDACKKQEERK